MKQSNILCLSLAMLVLSMTSCVQETREQTVDFEVNAADFDELYSLGVRGDIAPLDWQQDYLLEDPDGDGIYTGQAVFDIPFDQIEIKFVINGDQFELDGQPNRVLRFDESQHTLYRAKFDSVD